MNFFATAPGGLSELLKEELLTFGAEELKVQPRGVGFSGGLEVAYRACLWSRLANRIFLTIADVELSNQEELTRQVSQIGWQKHMDTDSTFAVSFSGKGMGIDHSHYGALMIKDGVVDYFRDKTNSRPSIDTVEPDLRIHGHLNRNQLTLSLDLVGYSLHQRGYREGQQVTAPLKENLAAALLMRAGWPAIAKQGGCLYDPMCGSGTFLIEAAMMASDLAPGLYKSEVMQLNFWKMHDRVLWQKLIAEAEKREAEGLRELPDIYGSDASHKSLDIAYEAIEKAGYDDSIEIKQMTVEQGRRWGDWQQGLVICNPPYGERLGELEEVKALYSGLGNYIKAEFDGWHSGIFTCNPELGMFLGIKAKRSHNFFNGALECKLLRFDLAPEFYREPAVKMGANLIEEIQKVKPELCESEGAIMVSNRIKKNLKQLKKWAKNNDVHAYRVYDADIPEYALSVDFYQTLDAGEWLVVNEYAPPKTVDRGKAKARLHQALAAMPVAFPEIEVTQMIFKLRQRQSGSAQYEKLDDSKAFYSLIENGTKLRVNFTDYLDTGLFLDHREVRALVAKESQGKSLLNLFCYTATASVEAAVWGAKSSLSVDMSKTYLYWAEHNQMHNKVDNRKHLFKQADVLAWLKEQSVEPEKTYDVIFMDPPSFSTSKRMDGTLDIQRDHVALIHQAMALLNANGVLIFSNNLRKFKLDVNGLEAFDLSDLTKSTMPKDFQRNGRIHQVWAIRK